MRANRHTSIETLRPQHEQGLAPDALPSRFQVVRALGQGGGGAVYEVVDSELGRVAVKVPLASDRSRQRLRTEIAAQRAAASARVCDVLAADAGEHPWLVMPLAEGGNLRLGAALAPGAIRALGLQLVAALRSVHAAGLAHLDVKPGNVLVGARGLVLTDFGLAAPLGSATSSVAGTPRWMAPELGRLGSEVTAAADVYSLSAVLLALLAGTRDVASLPSTPLVSTLRAGMRKEPSERPSLGELRTALREAGRVAA